MTTAAKTKLLVTPLPGRLLIEEDRPQEAVGRILVPEKYRKLPSVGIVVAIGKNTDTPLIVGDRVVYNMYSGTAIAVKGMERRYRTLVPDECLVTVEHGVDIDETGA